MYCSATSALKISMIVSTHPSDGMADEDDPLCPNPIKHLIQSLDQFRDVNVAGPRGQRGPPMPFGIIRYDAVLVSQTRGFDERFEEFGRGAQPMDEHGGGDVESR